MKSRKPLRTTDYMGLAFQFLGAIILGILLGRWLDGFHKSTVPIWSLLIPVLMVIGVLVRVVKETMGKKKD